MDRELHPACRLSAVLPRGDARVPWVRLLAGLPILDSGLRRGEACARPLPNQLVKTGLILATILVVAALGLDFIAPLFVDS